MKGNFGKSDEAFHKIAPWPATRVAKAASEAIPLDKTEHDLESFNN